MALDYQHWHYITNGDMVADVTGDTIDLTKVSMVRFASRSTWTATGSPVGNIIIQVSYDGAATWVNLDTTAAGGGAGTDTFEDDAPNYTHMRVFYDMTSDGIAANLNVHLVMVIETHQ